jgi:tetratricopeptide (TPR) repeat protein
VARGALRAAARDVVLKQLGPAVALAALLVVAPRPARAGDVEVARRLFVDGVSLFERGDYEGARRLFRKADAEHHAAPIVYNLGLAEERVGHPQAAVDAYEAYVAEKGDAGELSSAAIVAIAQIKARSTRVRVETTPPGARVFVDALTLTEPSPATLLVSAGHHVLVAQGDGWRAEQDLDAKGTGDTVTVTLGPATASDRGAPRATEAPLPPSSLATEEPVEAGEPRPRGFVWGLSFALVPFRMQGATSATPRGNTSNLTQAAAGALAEVGYALTERFEFLARGMAAIGPNGKPTYAWMAGPGLSYRALPRLWVGLTFLGGQLETKADGVVYGTDLVFGAMVEVGLVLLSTPHGQWCAGAQPGLLLTDEPSHNTAYLLPLTFGYRSF